MPELAVWTRDVLGPTTSAEESITSVVDSMNIEDLDLERRRFLTDLSSFDVSACPGSGKTTLVVAKLLLLSRGWNSRTRGMLMLSHTNVAKNEVARRFDALGEKISVDGRPHYVGTIHSFVNKFLTTPYLLSLGIQPKPIDDDITLKVRAHLLGNDYYSLKNFLTLKHTSLEAIRITDSDLERPFGDKLLNISSAGTASYGLAAGAAKESVRLGYLRHDEIFVFANRYLDAHPEVLLALRYRFPFVMIDEMQDTTTEQAKLLVRIFPQNDGDISVERIGDPNQAIYGPQQNDFPLSDHLTIADSFRFDETIARLASPLAVHSIRPSGLRGTRVVTDSPARQHAFIVFHADAIDQVLPTFAQIVAETTPDHIIRSSKISALGARHYIPADEADNPKHFPKALRHYLPSYAPSSAEVGHTSRSFSECIMHARALVDTTGGLSAGLEHIADGLLRYVNGRRSYSDRLSIKSRKFRQLVDLLASVGADGSDFRECLSTILSPRTEPTFGEINNAGALALALVTALTTEQAISADDTGFFEAHTEVLETMPGPEEVKPSNAYRHSTEGAADVLVELSSIHAAKGETHGATLVLDTFNRARFVEKLLPWLAGKKSNAPAKASDSEKRRLHECYVAMTRPTQLLAVAAVEKSLGKTEAEIAKSIDGLEAHGWKVLRLSGQSCEAMVPGLET